jgi:tetratricopeptide (TPR) repeat protein
MANTALIEDLLRQYAENPRRVFARLANELRKSGDYDRAIEICRGQIPQQPGYISGHIVLGQSLYDCGRLEEARQTFETALNLDPENLIALRHLGDIARQHGENEVAKGWYRRLLEVDPQNDEVVALLEAMGTTSATNEPPLAEALAPTIDLTAPKVEGVPPPETAVPKAPDIGLDEYKVEKTGSPVTRRASIEIETADAFEPSAGAEKAFPDLEQSLEVSGLGSHDAAPQGQAAQSQSMFGDSAMDQKTASRGEEPRDAVDAFYPMLDVQATAPSPDAFVTETMAELYLQQGYVQEALDIYRQLAAKNPNDANLRERVRQLEQGARSSIGIAAISDEVVEKAHKRATEKPKKTVRHFFAKLAMRRVVEREAPPPPPAAAAPSPLDEPAWLRSDPEPEPPPPRRASSGGESGGFPMIDQSEWQTAVPRTPPRRATPRPPAQDDVPWLAGYEPDSAEGAQQEQHPPRPTTGEPIAIPPSELFPTRSIPTEDENAAARLASVFEPEFAARLTPVHPVPTQPSASDQPPARKAEEELSLDQVFGRTPTSSTKQPSTGFTFDQFFDEKKEEKPEGEKDASSEIELFNTWLDQLKK